METKPVLNGSRVILRQFSASDVADRMALGQHSEIVRMFGTDPATIGDLRKPAVENWIESLAKHPFAWAMDYQGKWIGEIRLDGVEKHDRRARLAVGLYDPNLLGQGLGREAIKLLLKNAFSTMQLHRVGLRVISYNTRAIRCYSACGFIEEGRERETAFIEGRWHDDVMMGLLAPEFAQVPVYRE